MTEKNKDPLYNDYINSLNQNINSNNKKIYNLSKELKSLYFYLGIFGLIFGGSLCIIFIMSMGLIIIGVAFICRIYNDKIYLILVLIATFMLMIGLFLAGS